MERIFRITDSRLMEHGGVTLEFLKGDLPEFTDFDPDLGTEKEARLRTLIQEALEEGGDDVVRGKLGEKTQSLLQAMDRCDETVKRLRYWVKKTFKNDPAARKRFRLSRYWKIRNNQPRLITYMSALATVVGELRGPLEAASTPTDLLDSLKPLSEEVEEANNVQENSKGGRGMATQERIIRLNEIYAICREFSDAAESIYSDDPAKREVYRLPGNSQPSTEDEEDDEDEDIAA